MCTACYSAPEVGTLPESSMSSQHRERGCALSMKRLITFLFLTLFVSLTFAGEHVNEVAAQKKAGAPGSAPGFAPASLFGMNLYLTGRERTDGQAAHLGQVAAQGGVRWAREELSWANLEPNVKGQ